MQKILTTRSGMKIQTPLFLPVYEIGNEYLNLDTLKTDFPLRGLITNAYFLYKQREIRKNIYPNYIKTLLDFKGLVVTDSGAFQALSGKIILNNKKIIRFQTEIGADIISPLDLITGPGDNKTEAQKKMTATLKRIEQGLQICNPAILIGVQQGGKYLDLRRQAIKHLIQLEVEYIALGSLVPFFNKNHHLEFPIKVIREARDLAGNIPIHLYGAGDPLELPFYLYCGCDIFDSSSFIHYAISNYYMTPFGAFPIKSYGIKSLYDCECPYCAGDIPANPSLLAKHNLWIIYKVMKTATELKERGDLKNYCDEIALKNHYYFMNSQLKSSWEKVSRDL